MKDRKDTSSDTDPAKPRPGATVRPQEVPSAESCEKASLKSKNTCPTLTVFGGGCPTPYVINLEQET